MKYKFIKQKPNTGACGPVALYNALIWLGKKPDIDKIYKEVRCDRYMGTSIRQMNIYLKKYKIKFQYKRHANMNHVIKALQKGHGVIYLYRVPDVYGHYVFMYELHKKYVMVANEIYAAQGLVLKKEGATQLVSMRHYAKCASNANILKVHYKIIYPQIWIIKK